MLLASSFLIHSLISKIFNTRKKLFLQFCVPMVTVLKYVTDQESKCMKC